MRLQPKFAGGCGRINASLLPPCRFVATSMDLAMMTATERHCELVADLAAERPVLGEAQMMRICRPATANQAWLLGYKPDVPAVANPARLGMGELTLVNARGTGWPGPPLT